MLLVVLVQAEESEIALFWSNVPIFSSPPEIQDHPLLLRGSSLDVTPDLLRSSWLDSQQVT